jgi:hypothetical protein
VGLVEGVPPHSSFVAVQALHVYLLVNHLTASVVVAPPPSILLVLCGWQITAFLLFLLHLLYIYILNMWVSGEEGRLLKSCPFSEKNEEG